jgi:hypothetical protein
VTASGSGIEQTYLFRHKIEYDWKLQLSPSERLWADTEQVILEPVSLALCFSIFRCPAPSMRALR